MNRSRLNRKFKQRLALCLATLATFASSARAEEVVLHLRNGDVLRGTIVSEDTNRITLATPWIKELPVPLSAIERREKVSMPAPAVAPTNAVAKPPTNAPATAKAKPAPTPNPAPQIKPTPPSHWKADLRLGTDLQFGARDRELYYARLKLTYERPYTHDPKKFFRNIVDYAAEYGTIDNPTTVSNVVVHHTVRSANRMEGSVKTDFDIGKRLFVYNLGGAGYDEIRKIELHYEDGPGAGYHLFTLPKFVGNVEAGFNYQVQDRTGSPDVENIYFRLAEDSTWKINSKLTFTEKFEFFPRADDFSQYRWRLDSTLSVLISKNLDLSFSMLDLYDTQPAPGVDQNELLLRSSLGIKF